MSANKQQGTKILFMISGNELHDEVAKLIKAGNEICTITQLREFNLSKLDGVGITDWLIVYKPIR